VARLDPDAVAELPLELDVQVLLHVERGEERAAQAERPDLLVGPVALARQLDVLRTRHGEGRTAGPEQALDLGGERRGEIEFEPSLRRGTQGGDRQGDEALERSEGP